MAAAAAALLVGAGPAKPVQFDWSLTNSAEAQQLRSLAAAHNVTRIETMRSRIDSAHWPALRGLYFVALYLADTSRHRNDFLANYPWQQNQEVSFIFQGKPWGVVPVVEALGAIAARDGNGRAIQLLFLASNHSDGLVAEGFSDYFVDVARKWPRQTLTALRTLPVAERNRALQHNGCIHIPELLALRPRNELERDLLARFRAIPRNLCA